MNGRREFLKSAITSAATWMLLPALFEDVALADDPAANDIGGFRFESGSISAELSMEAHEFRQLSIDGLGKGRRGANIVDAKSSTSGFRPSSFKSEGVLTVEYRSSLVEKHAAAEWAIELRNRTLVLTSEWSPGIEPAPMIFHLNLPQVHSTVLGAFRSDGLLAFPALMHFPGQGSMRITVDVPGFGMTYQCARHAPATWRRDTFGPRSTEVPFEVMRMGPSNTSI